MITPKRSAKNTRLYSHEDVERLRRIQQMTAGEGLNLAGVESVLALEQELERTRAEVARMRARADELEREMNAEVERVRRSLRNELVPYGKYDLYTPDLHSSPPPRRRRGRSAVGSPVSIPIKRRDAEAGRRLEPPLAAVEQRDHRAAGLDRVDLDLRAADHEVGVHARAVERLRRVLAEALDRPVEARAPGDVRGGVLVEERVLKDDARVGDARGGVDERQLAEPRGRRRRSRARSRPAPPRARPAPRR